MVIRIGLCMEKSDYATMNESNVAERLEEPKKVVNFGIGTVQVVNESLGKKLIFGWRTRNGRGTQFSSTIFFWYVRCS